MEAPKTLFLSHGSPMIVQIDSPARRFLVELGRSMPRPRAVLVVSAHWQAPAFSVGSAASPATIHDFYGFPPALYTCQYPAPGAPEMAALVAERTGAAVLSEQGLDHGVWTVMSLLWPDATVPVVPLSLVRGWGPAEHCRLGQQLAPLLDDGVLLVGSGAATHNLAAYRTGGADQVPAWVSDYTDWMASAVTADRRDDLVDYRRQAPHARDNHPSEEHLLPLFVAMAAARGGGRVLHRSIEHGVLAMDCYGWGYSSM